MRSRFALFTGCLLVMASVSSHAESQPSPGSAWIGHHTVTACASGRFARIYPAHPYRPTFDIDVSSAPNGLFNLRIQTRGHTCDLWATLRGSSLVVAGGQTCELGIATPDFCVLKGSECTAGGPRQSCEQEDSLHHLGALIGTVTQGELSRQGGRLQFTFDAKIDGCVLAIGHNKNVPVTVAGGRVASVACP
ncbi:hypothetical protein WMF30_51655 [Sorangium sp. So ce134]